MGEKNKQGPTATRYGSSTSRRNPPMQHTREPQVFPPCTGFDDPSEPPSLMLMSIHVQTLDELTSASGFRRLRD